MTTYIQVLEYISVHHIIERKKKEKEKEIVTFFS